MATMTATPEQKKAYVDGYQDAQAGNPATPPKRADLAAMYDQGFQDSTNGTTPIVPIPKASTPPAKATGAKKSPPTSKAMRRPSTNKRRVAGARRTARKVARAGVAGPGGGASPGQVIAYAVFLALAYNAITNSAAVAAVFDLLTRAVTWLGDPTRSITYKEH